MQTIPKHHLYRQHNQPVGADSISAHNSKRTKTKRAEIDSAPTAQRPDGKPQRKSILKTLENASVNVPQNALVNIEGMKTPDAIIALIQADNAITRQQMAERMGKDVRTIDRAIKKLQDEGKLQRVGSNKAGHWEVL